jgi:hypothetical protein
MYLCVCCVGLDIAGSRMWVLSHHYCSVAQDVTQLHGVGVSYQEKKLF